MPVERVRKPRDKPAPYARKPGPKGKHAKDKTETSAKSAAMKQRDNLTLRDWLTVFAFINAHPTLSQEQVTTAKALEMCKILGSYCLSTSAGSAMELSKVLHCF